MNPRFAAHAVTRNKVATSAQHSDALCVESVELLVRAMRRDTEQI